MDSVAVTMLVLVLAAIDVSEYLRNHQDLNDLLDDNSHEPDGTPEVVVEVHVLMPHPQVIRECVPALVEWSEDGEDDKSLQNTFQGLIILNEASKEPCDADGDIEVEMVLEARAPPSDTSPLVEEDPGEHTANTHDQVVRAVPVHGLSIIEVADPTTDSVFGRLSTVATVVLSVTHTCSKFF